jgi:hypothetical protein
MKKSIAEQFSEFHEKNPVVYERLLSLALQMREKGHRKIGIKMLFEVLRWEQFMETNDPNNDFKLNNNYTSHYSRLLMESHPLLQRAFETRQLTRTRSRV